MASTFLNNPGDHSVVPGRFYRVLAWAKCALVSGQEDAVPCNGFWFRENYNRVCLRVAFQDFSDYYGRIRKSVLPVLLMKTKIVLVFVEIFVGSIKSCYFLVHARELAYSVVLRTRVVLWSVSLVTSYFVIFCSRCCRGARYKILYTISATCLSEVCAKFWWRFKCV